MRRRAVAAGALLALLLPVDAALAAGEDPYPRRRDKLSISADYERFDRTFSPWRVLRVQYTRRFPGASAVARLNAAHRFDENGIQYELDLYPKLPGNGYVYLNVGLSGDSRIFPERRFGAEIYRSLPRKLEASLGVRRLEFTSTDVTLYTGSLAKYHGSYWVSLRPWFVSKESGSSTSLSLSVRRYYGSAEEHLTISAGYGQRQSQVLLVSEVAELMSWKVGLAVRKPVSKDVILEGDLGVKDREFHPGSSRRSWTIGGGLVWLF